MTAELRVRADQGRTASLVTAVLTVLVAVTLVAGLDTLPQVRAGELSRGADLGGTLSLVTEVLTVRDPVTLPGLGETLVGTVAAELFCAAGLVSRDSNLLLIRIISTVVITIIYPQATDTLSISALKLIGLAGEISF